MENSSRVSHTTFTPLHRAIDAIDKLSLEDQKILMDLIHRRLVERQRTATQTVENLRHDPLNQLLDELAGCLGQESAQDYNFQLKIGSFYEAR